MMESVEIHPLTSDRWNDFETLFGKSGACGGCWCMYWRLKRSEYKLQIGNGNREAIKQIVQRGEIPGLLAYVNEEPAGWVSVAPRDEFSVLERSKILSRIDDQPVWSVVCFFVQRKKRNLGLSEKLLLAAVEYARQHGAGIVEGYPVEPQNGRKADISVYTGLASVFKRAGFVEVARRSEMRPMMRYCIQDTGKGIL